MPTPVGPAPRDPNDPDFWDFDLAISSNGVHDDASLDAELARRRRRRQVVAFVVICMFVFVLVASAI